MGVDSNIGQWFVLWPEQGHWYVEAFSRENEARDHVLHTRWREVDLGDFLVFRPGSDLSIADWEDASPSGTWCLTWGEGEVYQAPRFVRKEEGLQLVERLLDDGVWQPMIMILSTTGQVDDVTKWVDGPYDVDDCDE